MKQSIWRLLGVVVLLVLAACGGSGGQSNAPTPQSFSYTVDPAVAPVPATTSGGDVLAATVDGNGVASNFIVDQVVISPASQAELDNFLTTYGGTVIFDDAVPAPPAGSGITLDPADTVPTQYTVRVDASKFPLDNFQADADKAGLTGKATISSDLGARLLALVTHERAAGTTISPNFVMEGGALTSMEEHPLAGGGYIDPFSPSWALKYGATGAKSNVLRAWQFVADNPPLRRTRVAIIDGGFWLDSAGRPLSASGTLSDLPATPLQYDMIQRDLIADGLNPARCTGGGVCNWHGNNSAAVAVGTHNNRYGGAGSGGSVADPILIKSNLSWGNVSAAIRTAVAWGADVISMSFSGECESIFCDASLEFNLYPALRNARDRRVLAIAAAGNDKLSTNSVPCKGPAVICVGALDDVRYTSKIDYSNYGPNVDLYAPTNFAVMPNGDTTPGLANAGGTSASTPFVAGIAAMMKAYAPYNATVAQMTDALLNSAWTDSPDGRVGRYVNAFAALEGAMDSYVHITRPATRTANIRIDRSVYIVATAYEGARTVRNIRWTSDGVQMGTSTLNAPLHQTETTLSGSMLGVGTHNVCVRIIFTDNVFVSDCIPVTVRDVPTTVTVQNPVAGASFHWSDTVNLNATTYDPSTGTSVPDGQLVWLVNGAATGITGHNATMPASTCGALGPCTVCAVAPDGGSSCPGINIIADPVDLFPSATITSPATGTKIYATTSTTDAGGMYANFTFTGVGSDPEDGTLSGASLQWTVTPAAGGATVVIGTGSNVTAKLYGTGCGTVYNVTLTVTDSAGQSSTHTIQVITGVLC